MANDDFPLSRADSSTPRTSATPRSSEQPLTRKRRLTENSTAQHSGNRQPANTSIAASGPAADQLPSRRSRRVQIPADIDAVIAPAHANSTAFPLAQRPQATSGFAVGEPASTVAASTIAPGAPLRRRRDGRPPLQETIAAAPPAELQASAPTEPQTGSIPSEPSIVSIPDASIIVETDLGEATTVAASVELVTETSESEMAAALLTGPIATPAALAAAFIAPPTGEHAIIRQPRIDEPLNSAEASAEAAPTEPEHDSRSARRRSLRSAAVLALAIPALLGTVALPAYAFSPEGDALADANARITTSASQSISVPTEIESEAVSRDSYSATSEEELDATRAASGYAYDGSLTLAGYLAPSADGWWRPLPGEITSEYGPRGLICNSVGCSSSFHEGMDFNGACGTPIKAANAGTVTFVGNAGSYGNRVIIDHGGGIETIYGHLKTGSAKVAVGDTVVGGQVIAEVGATGVVSGCHLDLKVNVNGEHSNPRPFLRDHGVTV